MLNVLFDKKSDSTCRVLCLGAHCDDIEIGCGGSILKLKDIYANIIFYWIVFSSNKERAEEAKMSADIFLENVKEKKVIIKTFRDGFFPYEGAQIKDFFEELKQEVSPDIVFTHYRNDLHQDHRLISELTWNTFRDHLILEYEVPKYDGDLGSPNFFVHLDESLCLKKTEYLKRAYKSQAGNHWFSQDIFLSLLRLRGVEANSHSKLAEAFYCRKIVY